MKPLLLLTILIPLISCDIGKNEDTQTTGSTSVISPIEAIRVELPKGTNNIVVNKKIIVTIDSLSNLFINGDKVTIQSLENTIKEKYLKDTTVKSVVFNGDLKANYDKFIKVLVIANKMGLKLAVNTSGVN